MRVPDKKDGLLMQRQCSLMTMEPMRLRYKRTMSLRDAFPLRAISLSEVEQALRRQWRGSLSYWLGRILLLGLALTLLALECEVYGSFDEWHFDLTNSAHAVRAVLRSLGPTR